MEVCSWELKVLTYIRGLVKLEGIEGRRVPEDGISIKRKKGGC